MRWILFVLLLLAAALTFVGLPELQRAVASGRWPRAILLGPPAILSLFIVGYAGYRFVLVRAGRYSAGKALVQVGLMMLVLTVVVGLVWERGHAPPSDRIVDLARPLGSGDPDARAMAAELVRYRPPEVATRLVPRLIELLDDPSPEVRRQAHDSLVALAGADPGGVGSGAAARWRAYWRERNAP
jgi:hypothetical protein